MTGPPPASPAPAGGADAAPAMIRVENVHLHFGGIRAVDGVSLEIAEGSITGLIGPNGAGKTTLFNVIAGVYRPSEGRVFLQDEDITGLKPHRLFHRGVLRTFQIAHEFSEPHRRREPDDGARRAGRGGAGQCLVPPRQGARARGGAPRPGGGRHPLPRPGRGRERARRRPFRRAEEASGTRTDDDDRAQDRLPRRGGRRCQPHPVAKHRRRHPPPQSGARLHLLHDRARHRLHFRASASRSSSWPKARC